MSGKLQLSLAGNGSPWRVTSRGGRGSLHTLQTLVQRALPDWRFMRVIEVQTSYRVVGCKSDRPNILTFIFLPPREVPLGRSWSGRLLYTGACMGESPTCGSGTHRRRTTGWFPGLISPVGSGQGAPSFTGPFWKRADWYLNRQPQGAGWKGNLSVSFSFSVFSVPLPLPWSLPLPSHPLNPENFLFVSLSFAIGIFVM